MYEALVRNSSNDVNDLVGKAIEAGLPPNLNLPRPRAFCSLIAARDVDGRNTSESSIGSLCGVLIWACRCGCPQCAPEPFQFLRCGLRNVAKQWLYNGKCYLQLRPLRWWYCHVLKLTHALQAMLNMALVATVIFGIGVQKLFFGELRALEIEVCPSTPLR